MGDVYFPSMIYGGVVAEKVAMTAVKLRSGLDLCTEHLQGC